MEGPPRTFAGDRGRGVGMGGLPVLGNLGLADGS
jgi:hypothetical protein